MNKSEAESIVPPNRYLTYLVLPFIRNPSESSVPLYFAAMSRGIPVEYPTQEELENRVRSFLLERLVGVGSETFPKDEKLGLSATHRLLTRHPDIYSILGEELISILDESEADLIPTDDISIRTFKFFGYPNEEEFLNGIEKINSDTLEFWGIPSERYKASLNFANQAYTYGREPRRKSGEQFICHPQRMVRYYLTAREDRLANNNPKTKEEVLDDIEIINLHDVLENVPGSRLEGDKLIIPDKRDRGWLSYSITPDQIVTLQALNAVNSKTYLADILRLDTSGKAAEHKVFDSLDNLPTLWYHKSWTGLLRKLVEYYTSMASLGWSASFSGKFTKATNEYIRRVRSDDFILPLSVTLLAVMLQETAISRITGHIRDKVREKYSIDLRNQELEEIFNKRMKQFNGTPTSYFSEELSLKNTAETYWRQFSEESPASFHPFGFNDLAPTINQALNMFARKIRYSLPYPGGFYDSWIELPFGETMKQVVRFTIQKVIFERRAKRKSHAA